MPQPLFFDQKLSSYTFTHQTGTRSGRTSKTRTRKTKAKSSLRRPRDTDTFGADDRDWDVYKQARALDAIV